MIETLSSHDFKKLSFNCLVINIYWFLS